MNDQDRFWDLNNVYRYRNENLRAMGFESYRAYLRSALWKSIRARLLAERGPLCERCNSRLATQGHHRAYDPATLRGEDIRSLTATCGRCHRKAEQPDVRRHAADRFAGANHHLFKSHPKGTIIWRQKRAAGRRRRAEAL